MDFVNTFDLMGFDDAGHLTSVYRNGKVIVNLAKARSNFLYLLAKYNQNLLKNQGVAVPDFFKTEFGLLLKDVEQGKDYSAAYQTVLDNCTDSIKAFSKMSTEKGLILALNELATIQDKKFAQKNLSGIKNNLERNFMLVGLMGNLMDATSKLSEEYISNDNIDVKFKSQLFKNVINYNLMANTAVKFDKGDFSQIHEAVANRA